MHKVESAAGFRNLSVIFSTALFLGTDQTSHWLGDSIVILYEPIYELLICMNRFNTPEDVTAQFSNDVDDVFQSICSRAVKVFY